MPGAANTIKPYHSIGAAPGDYGAGPESIGFQTLSPRRTLPSYTFGSVGTRTRQRDRFKQDRVTVFGVDSPGPCEYEGHKVLVAFGKSCLSGKRMSQSAKFGTSGKFCGGSFKKVPRDRRAMTPGPGKYQLLSSIGLQHESQRPSTAGAKFTKADKNTNYFIDPFIPGPGQYGFGDSRMFQPKSPRFGFGTTRKFRDRAVIMRDHVSPRQRRLAEAIKHTTL